MTQHEVGVVYRSFAGRAKRLYLAIAPDRLLTVVARAPVVVRSRRVYPHARYLSVEELCESWGISIASLDELTVRYLPAQPCARVRPRGPKRGRDEEAALWRALRTPRLVRA